MQTAWEGWEDQSKIQLRAPARDERSREMGRKEGGWAAGGTGREGTPDDGWMDKMDSASRWMDRPMHERMRDG